MCTPGFAAENAVLLEGFETNLDSVTVLGSRATLSTYTATDPTDIHVTQGTKSLQVEIADTEFWAQDFRITFNDDLSAKIRAACLSPDVARYILRWDAVFPESGVTAWMNSQMQWDGVAIMNDQLDSNNGKLTMSVALDLVGTNVAPEGPISITLAQNFDATEDPFTTLRIYFDNFRLVDTYTPGAKPIVYPLQSFESANNPIGGATNYGGGTRTTYSQYTAQDPTDNRVSEGVKALQVDYATSGWGADFAIPFAGTKLAEILKLDLPAEQRPTADQLARYTMRWETTYFPRSDTSGSWMNTSYNTVAQGMPWSESGLYPTEEGVGMRKTYSITLDQITWSDTAEGAPTLAFYANGEWTAPVSIYYDNFRLIDTGATGNAGQPQIQQITLDAQKKVVITWTGGGILQSSPSLSSPAWTAVPGAASGTPIDPPATGVAFYRVSAP
jgi:hypothetical protein